MSLLEHISGTADIRRCSFPQLEELCGELREALIKNVSVTGGHLASNLGAVELTVALHNVYDPMVDRIVFDVGHQSYVHKMLTGRLGEFSTLRQEDGLSGFPKPEESPADAFIAGHASNSVSVALGMARARTLRGEDYDVVAVMGDGALTGGLAFEGLNNAGQSREPLVIVLNDNGIAINHTVGGMAKYLTRQRVRPAYYRLKRAYRKALLKTKAGTKVFEITQRWKNKLKAAIFSCTAFEEMGFRYMGPVDGHNVRQLSYMLNVARSYREPVLLHVVTQKGKGYPDAERNPARYHSVGPFDPEKGAEPRAKTCFSTVFGEEILVAGVVDVHELVAPYRALAERLGREDFLLELLAPAAPVAAAEHGHDVPLVRLGALECLVEVVGEALRRRGRRERRGGADRHNRSKHHLLHCLCFFPCTRCVVAKNAYSPTALRTFSIVGAAAARARFAPSCRMSSSAAGSFASSSRRALNGSKRRW